jgi:hypothetical protein
VCSLAQDPPFALPDRYILQAAFSDVTGTGIINLRLVKGLLDFCEHVDLTDEEKGRFLRLLLMIANKLGAVWYHKERYKACEIALIAKARANPIDQTARHIRIDCSAELFYEFDALLVQAKSCLDHLVKIPRVFVGQAWSLTTFGSYGQDVVNTVRRNLAKQFEGSSKGLLMVLERDLPWLKDLIEARDKINHLIDGGVEPGLFAVFAVSTPSAKLQVHTPAWSKEQPISSFVDIAWSNLYHFVEDFIGFSIVLRLSTGQAVRHRSAPPEVVAPVWFVATKEEMERETSATGWVKYAPAVDTTVRLPAPKDPCHCKSGRQYRRCCLPSDQAKARAAKE